MYYVFRRENLGNKKAARRRPGYQFTNKLLNAVSFRKQDGIFFSHFFAHIAFRILFPR
jgi:hypothetical protein